MKFLLDANFIMIPVQFKVDIYSELQKFGRPEIYTLDTVIREVGKIKGGNLALEILHRHKITVLEGRMKDVDREIEGKASEGFTVCTLDRKLSESLSRKGLRTVYLRQGKYLEKT